MMIYFQINKYVYQSDATIMPKVCKKFAEIESWYYKMYINGNRKSLQNLRKKIIA